MKKTKGKSPAFACFMVLIAVLIIAITPTEAEGAVYEDTVRLHILANSDTEADQQLKLQIRDYVLEEYSDELKCCKSKDEAEQIFQTLEGELCLKVNEKIKELGFDYSATAEIDVEWYDTRKYESFTLPAGYYSSVKILIGEGEGKNWWCVMYPPLCFDMSTSDANLSGYNDAEVALINGEGYSVKFKLLEFFSELTR